MESELLLILFNRNRQLGLWWFVGPDNTEVPAQFHTGNRKPLWWKHLPESRVPVIIICLPSVGRGTSFRSNRNADLGWCFCQQLNFTHCSGSRDLLWRTHSSTSARIRGPFSFAQEAASWAATFVSRQRWDVLQASAPQGWARNVREAGVTHL